MINGRPAISYRLVNGGDLKFARAGDSSQRFGVGRPFQIQRVVRTHATAGRTDSVQVNDGR